jgi:hypothetical protein
VKLDDLAADRRAPTGSARLVGQGAAGLGELLEDTLMVLCRNAHAGVGDADDDLVGSGRRTADDAHGDRAGARMWTSC